MSTLQEFLNQMVEKFPNDQSLWHMLAKHGHPGRVEPFTKAEAAYLKMLKDRIGGLTLRGLCYMNAQKLALEALANRRVEYVEGLVTTHGVPIDHAWIEYKGKVYDPTLNGGTDHDYHGVIVPKEEILEFQFKIRTYSPLSIMGDDKLLAKIWK